MLRRFHRLPLLFLLIGVVATLGALFQRYRAEARSRAVAMVLDYAQFRALIASTGIAETDALGKFQKSDITGVAITEETLADLQSQGVLQIEVKTTREGFRQTQLLIGDPRVADRVAEYVPRFVRGATERPPHGDRMELPGPGGGTIYVPGRFDDIKLVPTGLDTRAIGVIKAARLEPIGRISNTLGLTEQSMRWELARVKALGIHTVIFSGEEVLGYRGLVEQTAQAFIDLGLVYGSVEFGKQRGDEDMSKKLVDRLVRVHSIASAEMARLSPDEAIERYARAAAERNIRLNFVRLPGNVSAQTFEDNLEYVRQIAQRTAKAGFGFGPPVLFQPVWPQPLLGKLVHALIGLGIGASSVLLFACLVPVRKAGQAGLSILVGGLCAALAATGSDKALQLVALLSAIVFPTLAFLLFLQPTGAFEDHEYPPAPESEGSPLRAALIQFAAMCAITLVGALMIGGILGELPYMVKVRSFAGIKASTVVPILVVGWVYLTGMTSHYPSWRAEREAMAERVRRFFGEQIQVWHIVAFVVGVAALALMVARSGNDSGIGVSDTELRFRGLLDRIVGVRPRTKEFLVGHPALLLGLAMAALPKWRRWSLPLLLAGAIGQVGMLNSFCHLHSPLKVTLLRTINGLWTGTLIGVVVVGAWLQLQRARRPRRERGRG